MNQAQHCPEHIAIGRSMVNRLLLGWLDRSVCIVRKLEKGEHEGTDDKDCDGNEQASKVYWCHLIGTYFNCWARLADSKARGEQLRVGRLAPEPYDGIADLAKELVESESF